MISVKISEKIFQIQDVALSSASVLSTMTIKQLLVLCMTRCDDFALSLPINTLIGVSNGFTTYTLTQRLPPDVPKLLSVVCDSSSVAKSKSQSFTPQTINDVALLCDQLLIEIANMSDAINNFRQRDSVRSLPQSPLKADPKRMNYHRTMSRTLSENEKVDHVFEACSSGNVQDLLCYLDLYGKDLLTNLKNSTSFTPLHHACFNGQYEICRVLLDNGADITVPAKLGMTCLHLATTSGHVEIIRLLLQSGADPFVQDMMGNTALDRAKMGNHQEIIELIRDMVVTDANPPLSEGREE
jgi:hypothetical protein